jgi:hypothetical protein
MILNSGPIQDSTILLRTLFTILANLRLISVQMCFSVRAVSTSDTFEPAFYHTDIADWGMAVHLARFAGAQAKVLVDPYQVFRIFHEILFYEWESGEQADIAYMIDQSHNLKGKIEAMIQTVKMAQELYAKAALVNYPELVAAQGHSDLVKAESVLQDAKAIEHAEGDRRHGEEVHRGNRFPVIAEKGKPALGRLRISRCPFHPTRDRSLRDLKTEHEKLAMDALRPHVGFSTTIRKINS